MINTQVKARGIFISRVLLSAELQKIGFKYKKVTENRKAFIERNEICASRAHYLRNVKKYRSEGYQVVYLDETWVNKNHNTSRCWLPSVNTQNILELISNRKLKLPKIPSGKGGRLIILHAGSAENGFIENCEEVFKGKFVDGDYHQEMNSKVFLNWFCNQLIPALDRPSVIV